MSLVVRDLVVELGGRQVLKDVSAEVAEGGWLGLVGPNGAGKTTLLRAVAGLVAYRGEIVLLGENRRGDEARAMARLIAYVPQRPQLPATMALGDYVMLGRTPHISFFGVERRADRAVVAEVLERLELTALASRCLGEVSGGEAQRALLGRALAQEAPLLILDEPTSGLDLGHQQQVLELADELRRERGLTVICSMHDLTVAGQYSEQLLLLVDGRPVASGRARQVLTEANLRRYFDASVHVLADPDDGVVVSPRRPSRDCPSEPASALDSERLSRK